MWKEICVPEEIPLNLGIKLFFLKCPPIRTLLSEFNTFPAKLTGEALPSVAKMVTGALDLPGRLFS